MHEALKKRRAYRVISPIPNCDFIIKELAKAAQIMPSCYNKQPWRYVFIDSEQMLDKMKDYVIVSSNNWCLPSNLIIAVVTKREFGCIIKSREYYLFDTGLAIGGMLLRGTELGVVLHPIAGFSPKRAREVLNISKNYSVIALLIAGQHDPNKFDSLSERALGDEMDRPTRKELNEICFENSFNSVIKFF